MNKLSGIVKNQSQGWLEGSAHRIKNKKWLRYSSNIARRILAAMESNNELNQKELGTRIGVTPQYISKVVKGSENLTLETIAKLSEALGVELITFPPYKYDETRIQVHTSQIQQPQVSIITGALPSKSVNTLRVVSNNQVKFELEKVA